MFLGAYVPFVARGGAPEGEEQSACFVFPMMEPGILWNKVLPRSLRCKLGFVFHCDAHLTVCVAFA